MEYNQPSEIVKDVNFGNNAKNKKLANEGSRVDKKGNVNLNFTS